MLRILFPLFFLYCALGTTLHAQIDPNTLHKQVRSLDADQKEKLLAYLRFLGADIDQEIVQLYREIPENQQSRADQYIRFLNMDPALLPRTSVTWDRDTILFGVMEEGSVLLDSFTVHNTGSAPYIVHDIRTACDCTLLQKPEFPVMPGESLTLRVEFKSKGKAGETEAGMVLFDNSSPNARNILYLIGTITPRRR
jgi:hypothetical protein